jgi:hypothetical protein
MAGILWIEEAIYFSLSIYHRMNKFIQLEYGRDFWIEEANIW